MRQSSLASPRRARPERPKIRLAPLLARRYLTATAESPHTREDSVTPEEQAREITNVTRAARLRQAILKRAFEGKLVPQDPNDEPASALLARIKRQREVQAARAKAAKPNGKDRHKRAHK